MKRFRGMQTLKMLAAGAVLLQAGGCDFGTINGIIQTILLGITAAGGVAILQNV